MTVTLGLGGRDRVSRKTDFLPREEDQVDLGRQPACVQSEPFHVQVS